MPILRRIDAAVCRRQHARTRRRIMSKPNAPRWRFRRRKASVATIGAVLEDYAQRGVELEALVATAKADAASGAPPKWTAQQINDDLFS